MFIFLKRCSLVTTKGKVVFQFGFFGHVSVSSVRKRRRENVR